MKTGIYTRLSVIIFSLLASAGVWAYDPVPPPVANKLNTTAVDAFTNLDASNCQRKKLDTENEHTIEGIIDESHHQSIIRTHLLGDRTARFLISHSERGEAGQLMMFRVPSDEIESSGALPMDDDRTYGMVLKEKLDGRSGFPQEEHPSSIAWLPGVGPSQNNGYLFSTLEYEAKVVTVHYWQAGQPLKLVHTIDPPSIDKVRYVTLARHQGAYWLLLADGGSYDVYRALVNDAFTAFEDGDHLNPAAFVWNNTGTFDNNDGYVTGEGQETGQNAYFITDSNDDLYLVGYAAKGDTLSDEDYLFVHPVSFIDNKLIVNDFTLKKHLGDSPTPEFPNCSAGCSHYVDKDGQLEIYKVAHYAELVSFNHKSRVDVCRNAEPNLALGTIELYEGNDATQDRVCTISPLRRNLDINFKEDTFGCPNDEARSLVFNNIAKGVTVSLYDSPSASASDDYITIEIKKDISRYVLRSFQDEGSFEDDKVKVTLNYDNGLDGKVSHLKVRVPSNKAPGRRIVGYFSEWRNGKNGLPTYLVSDIPWSKVSHINYAFAKVNSATNRIDFVDREAAVEMSFPGQSSNYSYLGHFNLLNTYKESYPHVKTLIAVGGWAESRGFYTMTQTAAGRETFADSVIDFIRTYGFDGVDIDYEYPTSTAQAGNPNDFDIAESQRPQLYVNFLQLIELLRDKIDQASQADGKQYLLTAAVPSSSWILGGMELSKYTEQLDFINVMTYDFHGAWNGFVGHQSALLPDDRDPETAELGQPVLNVDWGYRYYQGVVAPGKINIGIPYYSRGWKNVQPGAYPGGLYGTAATSGGGATGIDNIWHDLDAAGQEIGSGSNPLWHLLNLAANRQHLSYATDWGISEPLTGRYDRYFDSISKVPYLWNVDKRVFLTLEDPESLEHKLAYTIQNGIGGIMIWELAGDYGKNSSGEYTVGHTMTTLAYDYFKRAGSADMSMGGTSVPPVGTNAILGFNTVYDHPNHIYTLAIHNQSAQVIDGGWVLEFDLPSTTSVTSIWEGSFSVIASNNEYQRIRVTAPSYAQVAPDFKVVLQGMMRLPFSGGPRNVTLNGSTIPVQVFPNWVSGQPYKTGDTVNFNGTLYTAVHDNPGYNPEISTWYWDPYLSQGCVNSAYPDWVSGTHYQTGDIVCFQRNHYIAEHDNPGYHPEISTWYWEPVEP